MTNFQNVWNIYEIKEKVKLKNDVRWCNNFFTETTLFLLHHWPLSEVKDESSKHSDLAF